MEPRPFVLVVIRANYDNDTIYEDKIETWHGAGYKEAFRVRSTDPTKCYTVMQETDDA